MEYNNPNLKLSKTELQKIETPGAVAWRSPSNLALVKYWGKYGQQLPKNSSISFTLDSAFTETSIRYIPLNSYTEHDYTPHNQIYFEFEGKQNEAFKKRIQSFISSLQYIFPFLNQFKLEIKSSNSFPHSSGIASSASSMSALALCLCSMEKHLFHTLDDNVSFLRKASFIARLGSGSACRSVYPEIALWGDYNGINDSSNYFAIPMKEKVHKVFSSFCNDILIVSSKKKAVSSSAGHGLMNNSVFAESRYSQARINMRDLLLALSSGDIEKMGEISEIEALSLHALMMTSNYMLIKPNSLSIMQMVRTFRLDTKVPLFFSLDAGPNIHLLYPKAVKESVKQFIESELKVFCEDGYLLEDKVGKGPQELTNKLL